MDSAFRALQRVTAWLALGLMLSAISAPSAEAASGAVGSIRGVVLDADFGAGVGDVRVFIVEARVETTTGPQGNYLFGEVEPGTYTLVFTKEGFLRQVRSNVVVVDGRLTEVDVSLEGDFADLEEFVVEDVLRLGTGSEAALLQLRLESPALMDSVSAELMSRAGASDAASALGLVSGASVQDGKFAVIRGLPDRYVSSQLNGIRLPSADEEKRAVELDQFPATVIESVQVSKTFTPDQQGDASGGAVNVVLKGVPERSEVQFQSQWSVNTNVRFRDDFLSYDGGGLDFWGRGLGRRTVGLDDQGQVPRAKAVGTTRVDAPIDSKWSVAASHLEHLGSDAKLGGFATFFYERDSSFREGRNDRYWLDPNVGPGYSPTFGQGGPDIDEFITFLQDVTQASQSVTWGGLASVSLETPENVIGLNALYTYSAEDRATLAENTRGKHFFFPGYDPDDENSPGNDEDDLEISPYTRTQALEYTERKTQTVQLVGEHVLPFDGGSIGDWLRFRQPEVAWSLSHSTADFVQPDKVLFGVKWYGPSDGNPATYGPLLPAINAQLGNLQRISKSIEETSTQGRLHVDLPFEQWGGYTGKLRAGMFMDRVERDFQTDTFSNAGESFSSLQYQAPFSDFFSDVWPSQSHPLTEALTDVSYRGNQDISASFAMVELPVTGNLEAVGGVRIERTDLQTRVRPEDLSLWVTPTGGLDLFQNPGDGDVDFSSTDVLPAFSLKYRFGSDLTLRTAYSETIARQTFRELTPVLQSEYVGAPIFSGNPDVELARLENYDLRLDYEPKPGSLISASWFRKDISGAIETVQRIIGDFQYTTVTNYPSGLLTGYEVEVRQDLARIFDRFDGWSVGGNATFIDSSVDLPDEVMVEFQQSNINTSSSRDASNAPDYLYNLYLNLDLPERGTRATLFYTVTGDTLIAGKGSDAGRFIPDLYQKEFGTLNFSLSQRLGKHWDFRFQAKNLLDPDIETAYRTDLIPGEQLSESYTRGSEFSIGFTYAR
ncbi:MAG: TonB-dependent receptor [Planctomycetota bacterium]